MSHYNIYVDYHPIGVNMGRERESLGWEIYPLRMSHVSLSFKVECICLPDFPKPTLLVEFYSNFDQIDFSTLSFRVFLWGSWYDISRDVVVAVLHIPRVKSPGYPFSYETASSRDEILTHFCDKGLVWCNRQNEHTHDFITKCKDLNLIITSNLMSVSHYNTFPVSRA